jgi:hypothetical protein
MTFPLRANAKVRASVCRRGPDAPQSGNREALQSGRQGGART